MKFFILFISLFFCLPLTSFAAPCYGTKMPGQGEFFGGFETHSILKRDLEAEYGKLRSNQHFLRISYGIWDWLSLDLKVGAGNIKQHPVNSDEIDYNSSFAGGYGFRIKFCDWKKIKIAIGFQHISIHPKSVRLEGVKQSSILDDWQVSFLTSYDFSKITPYLGIKFSRVDYIHRIEEDRKRKMSDLTKSTGLVCGLDIILTEKMWLNLEGQFLDSQALACSFNFKF